MNTKNNKLHFLESIKNEIINLNEVEENERIDYFLQRIDSALINYNKLKSVFKPGDFQYLQNWKEVFTELKNNANV